MAYTTNLDKRYLDLNGLSYYDGKLKEWVGGQFTTKLTDYYTIAAANAKFATIADFTAYQTSNDNAVNAAQADATYAKNLWTSFLADGKGGTITAAPTLNEIKTFIDAVPGTYSTKTDLTNAINGLSSVYLTQDAFTTAQTNLNNSIIAVDDKAKANTANIATLAQTVADNKSAYDTKVAALDAKDGELELAIGTVSTELANYKTSNDAAVKDAKDAAAANATNIAALTTTVNNNATAATKALNDYIALNDKAVEDVDAKADANAAEIAALKTGLSGAVHFRGVVDDLNKVTEPKNGDIVIVDTKEYVYVEADAKWELLGDTTEEGGRLTALETAVGALEAKDGELATSIGIVSTDLANHISAYNTKVGELVAKDGELELAIGTVVGDLAAYKTENNAAVKDAKDAADAVATALNEYKTSNDTAVANCVKVADFITDADIDALFA